MTLFAVRAHDCVKRLKIFYIGYYERGAK